METEPHEKETILWYLWQNWTLATTVTIALGLFLGTLLQAVLWPMIDAVHNADTTHLILDQLPKLLVIGLVTGGLCGFAQQRILRRYAIQENDWLLATTVGWILALVAGWFLRGVIDDVALPGIMGGALIGTVQWFHLRRNVPQSGWWILAWALPGALPLNWIIYGLSLNPIPMIISGLVIGLSTGITLSLLVRPFLQVKPI